MINYCNDSVFDTDAEALVNAVNCVGVMGAGVALAFKNKYPEMFADYQDKCNRNRREPGIVIGKVDYFKANDGHIVINFPTKYHYKNPSQLAWIEQGLKDFVDTYKGQGIKSVAFPAIGTGYGNLSWKNVHDLMYTYLSDLDLKVYICLNLNNNK